MSEYLNRFKSMVKELEKYDFLEIVEFKTQKPVTNSQLKAFEKKIGVPLAKSVRDFYEETNGLKLRWRIRPNLSMDDTKKLKKKSTDYYVLIAEPVEDPFAMINILSLEDVIKSYSDQLGFAHDEKKVAFDGKEYEKKEFLKYLRFFDVISSEYCAAFFSEPENDNPPVVLLNDGCAEWSNSRRTDFEAYMEILLATRGIVEARTKIFEKTLGEKEPPLKKKPDFWEKYAPKMFGK